MRYSFAIVFLLFCVPSVFAQIIEVHGGSSTLFDSKGGEIEFKGSTYDASFGAGTIGPRLLGGATASRRFESSTVTLGAEEIPFNLPTDIFDASHYLTTVGGSLRTTLPNASILLFGGMTSQDFEAPFFHAVRGIQPAAVFLFDGRVSPAVSVASRMILTRQITLIESLSWRPTPWAQLAASGGVGSGKAYGAVSAKLRYSIFDLKTAYIQASPGFRRADVDTVITAEPDRMNAVLTITPNRRVSVTVGHQQYLTPVAGSTADTHSSIDQVQADTEFAGAALSASVFHSTYQGGSDKAFVLSGSRTLGPKMRVQTSYLYSSSSAGGTTTSAVTNLTEILSPRWTVSQIVNNSNGQSTLGFGTSFLSNLATFSADYETYYLPQRQPSPFEQALILNADVNLFGRTTLQGGTFVAADGSVKHTVAANGVFAHNGVGAPASERNPVERFVIVGRVVDEFDRPVEGAALLIDRIPVYTDSDGNFILREHQARFHALQILPKQFLDGNDYMVLNATHNVRSTLPDDAVMAVFKVQKIPRNCPHGAHARARRFHSTAATERSRPAAPLARVAGCFSCLRLKPHHRPGGQASPPSAQT